MLRQRASRGGASLARSCEGEGGKHRNRFSRLVNMQWILKTYLLITAEWACFIFPPAWRKKCVLNLLFDRFESHNFFLYKNKQVYFTMYCCYFHHRLQVADAEGMTWKHARMLSQKILSFSRFFDIMSDLIGKCHVFWTSPLARTAVILFLFAPPCFPGRFFENMLLRSSIFVTARRGKRAKR